MNNKKNKSDWNPENQVIVNLSNECIGLLDQLKLEYGAESRGRVIELLLEDLLRSE